MSGMAQAPLRAFWMGYFADVDNNLPPLTKIHDSNGPLSQYEVSLNDDIPRFFYPPEPVKAISADDLRFHMELMGLR
jgi:hypothetical protein